MGTATTRAATRPWRGLFAAALTLLALAAPAAAQNAPAASVDFPRLSGRVVDEAGVLDPGVRAMLTSKLAALAAKTSDQVVVATVKSLQGYSVEDYATRLFRHWRLGDKDKNNGVLFLVAPADRKVRIEVGYGLEGTLTDAVAKLIIEQSIVPRFRANDFAGGIVRGTDDIVSVLTGDALAWQRRATAASAPEAPVPIRYGGTAPPDWADFLIIGIFGSMLLVASSLVGYFILILLTAFLVWLGALPTQSDRRGAWLWLDYFNTEPKPEGRHSRATRSRRSSRSSETAWASSSSSSSSSSDSFSGGGGSSGGGGASGSW